MTSVFIAHSIEEFKDAASFVVELMQQYRIFLLRGELGAGKTTFVQVICALLKTDDIVTSPTFALINPYETEKGRVFHMDMYRVNSVEEAIDFGIEEYLWEDENYCFIEWPDRIEMLLPEDYVDIRISQKMDQSREIRIENISKQN